MTKSFHFIFIFLLIACTSKEVIYVSHSTAPFSIKSQLIALKTTGIADTTTAFLSGSVKMKVGQTKKAIQEKAALGITIACTSTDNKITLGAVTDAQGNFKINGLSANTYTLDIAYVGYSPINIPNLQVDSGEQIHLDAVLGQIGKEGGKKVIYDGQKWKNKQ